MKENILDGLPDKLKDPKRFKGVQYRLNTLLKTDHVHKSVNAYKNCKSCTVKREARSKLMLYLGFLSVGQYLQWRRVMEIIINKKNV